MSWFIHLSQMLSSEWKQFEDGNFYDDEWSRLQTSIGCGWIEMEMHLRYWSRPYDVARNAKCIVSGCWGNAGEIEERLCLKTPEFLNPRRFVEAIAEDHFRLRLTSEGLKLAQQINELPPEQSLDLLRKAQRIAVGSIHIEPSVAKSVRNESRRLLARSTPKLDCILPSASPVAKFNTFARLMRMATSKIGRFLNYGAVVPPPVVRFCMRSRTDPVLIGEIHGSCYVEALWNYLMRIWEALREAGADTTTFVYDPIEFDEEQVGRFSTALKSKIGEQLSAAAVLATLKHGARGEIDRALSQGDCPNDAIELRDAVVWVVNHTEGMLKAQADIGIPLQAPTQTPRLDVKLHPPMVTLDNTNYTVAPDGAMMVKALIEAKGDWLSGSSIGITRADRTLKSLPDSIRNLIESAPAKGYRISLGALA